MAELRIGTCSWKYPSWRGLVYSAAQGINYLQEYAARFNTVEVGQWFWSVALTDRTDSTIERWRDRLRRGAERFLGGS